MRSRLQSDTRASGPCKVLYFEDCRESDFGENSIFYIDNRPGEVHSHEKRLLALSDTGGVELAQLAALVGGDLDEQALRELLAYGFKKGLFKDTLKLTQWIKAVNGFMLSGPVTLSGPNRLKPLQLVICHAETQIYEIYKLICKRGVRPAAVIFSGSPLMLSEEKDRELPSVQKTLVLIKELLRKEIPLLGICFGFHLLTYARFGVLPQWLVTPKWLRGEFHSRIEKNSPVGRHTICIPGERKMVFGSRTIKRFERSAVDEDGNVEQIRMSVQGQAFMNGVSNTPGLEVHSQYIDPRWIPDQYLLAISDRFLTPDLVMTNLRKMFRVSMVEAIQASDFAFGTQLHPELTLEHMLSLLMVPHIREQLQREGYRLNLLWHELNLHPIGHYAGQRLGYNFIKRIVAENYVRFYIHNERVQAEYLRRLHKSDSKRQLRMAARLA